MKTELVSTLKRKATEIIAKLTDERDPVLINEHHIPAAYLVNVQSFESMEARLRLLEGIAKGEKAVQEGRVIDNEEAKRRMSRWL